MRLNPRSAGGLILFLAAALIHPATASRVDVSCHTYPTARHDHSQSHPRGESCRMRRIARLEVSKKGGLGRIEIAGKRGAVLQRDEGIVALLDLKNPSRPRVVGRYSDDASQSLDGDLAFSADGKWLFYARQTVQFSRDGIHVLDVSDPRSPTLASYQPGGGTLRVAYHRDGDAEWVVTLDAVAGLVVNRFERTTGELVPVHVDPLPALKVGGPASAGIEIVPDLKLGAPLMYVTTGTTGLQIFDFSNPLAPELLGEWEGAGLADVAIHATRSRRVVVAVSEYWFDEQTKPALFILDATKLGKIVRRDTAREGFPADDLWRVQGIELDGELLHVAYSHAGLVTYEFFGRAPARGVFVDGGRPNPEVEMKAAPYAMDVARVGPNVYVTDAATGALTVVRPSR